MGLGQARTGPWDLPGPQRGPWGSPEVSGDPGSGTRGPRPAREGGFTSTPRGGAPRFPPGIPGRQTPPGPPGGSRPPAGPRREKSPLFPGNPSRGVTGGPPREVDVKGGPETPVFGKIGLFGPLPGSGTSEGAKISILTEIPFDFGFLKSCGFQSKSGKMRVNTRIPLILAIFG